MTTKRAGDYSLIPYRAGEMLGMSHEEMSYHILGKTIDALAGIGDTEVIRWKWHRLCKLETGEN
jgi:hypothetical protein